jgi:hypothetical protein
MVAFGVNRAAINRNQATIQVHQRIVRQQRTVLTYLCRTVHLLDTGYLQQADIARQSLRDPSLPPSARARWRSRLQVYLTIHQELSDTRACRQIE